MLASILPFFSELWPVYLAAVVSTVAIHRKTRKTDHR